MTRTLPLVLAMVGGCLAPASAGQAGDVAAATQAKAKRKPAPADRQDQAMTFAIMRFSSPACEPFCQEWIVAEGEITRSSPALFRRLLDRQRFPKRPMLLQSPGGDVDAALAIGRMVRKAGLEVIVARAQYSGCAPADKTCRLPAEWNGIYRGAPDNAEAYCASACPLILAGGAERRTGVMGYVGLHQIRTTWVREVVRYRETTRKVNGRNVVTRQVVSRKHEPGRVTYGLNKALRRKLTAYLDEMGVSRGVLEEMEKAPLSGMNWLSAGRSIELKLAMPHPLIVRADRLATACIGEKPEANCVIRAMPKPAPAPADAMTVVTMRATGGCKPLCPEWIAASGVMTPDTPLLFKPILAQLGGHRLPVVISSPGGDFDAALVIGRMIRKAGLPVAVAETAFIGCDVRDGDCRGKHPPGTPYKGMVLHYGTCGSECLLVLAGGVRRYAAHASGTILPPAEGFFTGDKARTARQLLEAYVREMSISPAVLRLGPDGPIARLDEAKLAELGFETDGTPPQDLGEAGTCASASPPSQCVRRD